MGAERERERELGAGVPRAAGALSPAAPGTAPPYRTASDSPRSSSHLSVHSQRGPQPFPGTKPAPTPSPAINQSLLGRVLNAPHLIPGSHQTLGTAVKLRPFLTSRRVRNKRLEGTFCYYSRAPRKQQDCTLWPNLSKLDAWCCSEQNSMLIYCFFEKVPAYNQNGNAKLDTEGKGGMFYLSQSNVSEKLLIHPLLF